MHRNHIPAPVFRVRISVAVPRHAAASAVIAVVVPVIIARTVAVISGIAVPVSACATGRAPLFFRRAVVVITHTVAIIFFVFIILRSIVIIFV